MAKVILELTGISRRLSERFAIEDISLELRTGEVHFITGENGSGKSVLMKLVTGLFQNDSGTIVMDGQSVSFTSLADARRNRIIYQQQDIELFENLSIAENVWFTQQRQSFGITPGNQRLYQRCQLLFDHLGIDLVPARPVSTLGYAQKLLVAACATFIAKGRVVIFDEPTAGMGDSEREVFFRIIRSLQRRGTGIFYISHRLDEIPAIGTRVTVLQQGKVTGHLEEVNTDRSTIIRMMIGKNCPERYPRLVTPSGPLLLSVEQLASAPVLKNISFNVHGGEILGLTGLMGSGRTRLANCLFGAVRPDAGIIRIANQNVVFKHPSDAMARGIAMVPEDRNRNAVFFRQDVLSNLVAAALPRFNSHTGLDTQYMEELSYQYLDSFSITPSQLKGPFHHCSGGNQQKVVIARSLMSLATVFIMDEPTRGIDAASRVDIYNAMNDIVAKGAAIIFISSDSEELLGMCDRILVLAGGIIVRELDRSTATKESLLDSATVS